MPTNPFFECGKLQLVFFTFLRPVGIQTKLLAGSSQSALDFAAKTPASGYSHFTSPFTATESSYVVCWSLTMTTKMPAATCIRRLLYEESHAGVEPQDPYGSLSKTPHSPKRCCTATHLVSRQYTILGASRQLLEDPSF